MIKLKGYYFDFFFMYSTLITHLHVHFPFDELVVGVLRILNIDVTHLHPNSWEFVQAFLVICIYLHLKPTS